MVLEVLMVERFLFFGLFFSRYTSLLERAERGSLEWNAWASSLFSKVVISCVSLKKIPTTSEVIDSSFDNLPAGEVLGAFFARGPGFLAGELLAFVTRFFDGGIVQNIVKADKKNRKKLLTKTKEGSSLKGRDPKEQKE